jgi:hypothetical protein
VLLGIALLAIAVWVEKPAKQTFTTSEQTMTLPPGTPIPGPTEEPSFVNRKGGKK